MSMYIGQRLDRQACKSWPQDTRTSTHPPSLNLYSNKSKTGVFQTSKLNMSWYNNQGVQGPKISSKLNVKQNLLFASACVQNCWAWVCVSFEMFGIFWLCKKSPCPVSQNLHDPPSVAAAHPELGGTSVDRKVRQRHKLFIFFGITSFAF